MKRNAFIDLDGTLLNKMGKISPNSMLALENLYKNNIDIVITSGRWPISVIKYNDEIEKYISTRNNYFISLNGSLIYDLQKKEIIKSFKISDELLKKIFQIRKAFKARMLIYTERGINSAEAYSYKIPFLKIFKVINSGRIRRINLKNYEFRNDTLKVLFFMINKRKTEEICNWMIKNMSDYLHCVKVSNIAIEITSLDSSKGNAIETISKITNVSLKNSIAFGDSNNDISMFEKVNLKYAIKPKTLYLANKSTCSVFSKDAFADSINQYLLVNKKMVVINVDDYKSTFIKQILNKHYHDKEIERSPNIIFYTQNDLADFIKKKWPTLTKYDNFYIASKNNFVIDNNKNLLFMNFIENISINEIKKILKKHVKKIKVSFLIYNQKPIKKIKSKTINSKHLKIGVHKYYYKLSFTYNKELFDKLSKIKKINVLKNDNTIILTSTQNSVFINHINKNTTILYSKNKIDIFNNTSLKK